MYVSQRLVVPTKLALLGIVVGAVSGLLLAQLNPGPTLAAVAAPAPFMAVGKALDTHLARFDGDYFAVANTPDVSLTPLSVTNVRKIGYGRTSIVAIRTTTTGTYSSDGLASPYVQYPGVFKQPLELAFAPFHNAVLGWSRLSGWVEIPLHGSDSFGLLDDVRVPASRDGVCVADNGSGPCR